MKIAIFGLARSGLSVFRYLCTQSQHEVFLVNQGDPSSWSCLEEIQNKIAMDHCFNQDDARDLIAKVDQIVLSPGIPREHPVLSKALDKGVPVISEIEFAFQHISDIPIIGITGTNGKTTTTTMIGEVLAMAGKRAFVCGNIGRPYTDLLLETQNYDYAVVELSSFQLESIVDFHPHIALILNITPNHAERYPDLDSYQKAKYQILKNQKADDYALLGEGLTSEKIKSQLDFIRPLQGFDFSKSYLVGEHNKMNFYCAYKVLEFLNIENREFLFQEFIDSFTGVEFRLQFIRDFQGLKIYNDGKSTNDAATFAAVDSFQGEEELFLILGGQPRSQVSTLDQTLRGKKIQQIFVFGQAQVLVKNVLGEIFDVVCFEKLEDIFSYIKIHRLKGNLLFSPAFPSFDQFKDYVERGRYFTQLAKNLSII